MFHINPRLKGIEPTSLAAMPVWLGFGQIDEICYLVGTFIFLQSKISSKIDIGTSEFTLVDEFQNLFKILSAYNLL